jgi:hypothetical protein
MMHEVFLSLALKNEHWKIIINVIVVRNLILIVTRIYLKVYKSFQAHNYVKAG